MASNTSSSKEKEFLNWIDKLNEELHLSSITDDHGTIKTEEIEDEPNPQSQLLRRHQKRPADKKKMGEKKGEPYPQQQLFPQLDQKRWAEKVKKMVQNELNPQQKDVRVCILHVPERLIEFKPKSYTPQLLGLGPYHHLKPDLQELERFKLAVIAKYLENYHSSPSLKFEEIVRELARYEPTICSCYHKYLDLDGDTLATIIAVDGLFLLEFVQGIAEGGAKMDERSGFVFAARKVTEADVIGDVMMLQNQFPLVLLKLLCLISSPEEEERDGKFGKVFGIWSSFCKLVSPFDTPSPPDGFFDHSMHFLDALYQQISRNGGESKASSNDGRNNC